jgi:alkylation response protein AidB-like acyl-CoA dehydrogenase
VQTAIPAVTGDAAQVFRDQARTVLSAACVEIGWDPQIDDPTDIEAQRRFHKALVRLGWGALAWPPEYGGGGRSLQEQATFAKECSRMRVPHVYNRVALGIAGPAIMLFGRPEQKTRFLPPMLAGDEVWCQGFSEPGAGSDLAGLSSRAELAADGSWRVTGQKVWTTLAENADHCLLLARTGPDRHKGITAFLMPMRQPGVEVRPIKQMNGADDFCEVFLNAACVSPELVLGQLGDGWLIAMKALENERSVHLVHRQVRLDTMIDSLVQTVAALGACPAVADALVELKVTSAAMKSAVRQYLRAIDAGEALDTTVNKTKVLWSETYQRVTRLAVDVAAATADQPSLALWLHEYYSSLATTIYAGTSEIQRNIIAERGLGLPR